jgi:3D (Asp-Asp-Asp) domain-containing protein
MPSLTRRAFIVLALIATLLVTPSTAQISSAQGNRTGEGVFQITGYTCPPFCGKTYSGTQVRIGVVAVDPDVIPLGSKVIIEGVEINGIREFIAEDTGSQVIGNHIDVFVPTASDAYNLTGTARVYWYQE